MSNLTNDARQRQDGRPRSGAILPDPATQRAVVVVIAAIAIVLALLFVWATARVLLLAFAGVLLGIFLRSLGDWVHDRTRLSEGWSLAVVGIALAAILGLGGWLLSPSIAEQIEQLGDQLPRALQDVRARVEQYGWGRQLVARIPTADELTAAMPDMLARVTSFFSTTLGVVVDLFVVLFVGFYLAADSRLYTRGLLHLVPRAKRARAREVLHTLGYTLRWWLLGRALGMLVVGVVTTLGLWLLGIPLALTLGLIAALLDFVPNVGPILAAAPAVLLALAQSPTQALSVAALYVAIQLAEGFLLMPLIEQRTVLLPPALIIVTQVVMTLLLGGVGLVLASPLLAIVVVLVKMLYIEDVLGEEVDVMGEAEGVGEHR